ncbi:MAG: methyltransferase domain-containing protein [Chlamydiales bacterium]|nr:methyltransferase domain-containing protein [Chlamydiales bacterium]
MKTLIYISLGFLALMVLIGILWRFSSRRLVLPCPVWLSSLVELDNPFTKTNRASSIIEHLDLKIGMKVLDAGCGPGRITLPIAKKIGPQGEVWAVDIQSGMLDRVQEKAKVANLHNIQFLQAGIGDGKLEHSQYDRALLVTVLGEIPHQETALKEIFNALKPGGILSITEVIFDPHFQSRKTVRRLAKTTGFQERCMVGNRFAFTMQFEKPVGV